MRWLGLVVAIPMLAGCVDDGRPPTFSAELGQLWPFDLGEGDRIIIDYEPEKGEYGAGYGWLNVVEFGDEDGDFDYALAEVLTPNGTEMVDVICGVRYTPCTERVGRAIRVDLETLAVRTVAFDQAGHRAESDWMLIQLIAKGRVREQQMTAAGDPTYLFDDTRAACDPYEEAIRWALPIHSQATALRVDLTGDDGTLTLCSGERSVSPAGRGAAITFPAGTYPQVVAAYLPPRALGAESVSAGLLVEQHIDRA